MRCNWCLPSLTKPNLLFVGDVHNSRVSRCLQCSNARPRGVCECPLPSNACNPTRTVRARPIPAGKACTAQRDDALVSVQRTGLQHEKLQNSDSRLRLVLDSRDFAAANAADERHSSPLVISTSSYRHKNSDLECKQLGNGRVPAYI